MHNIDLLNELLGEPTLDLKSIKDSRKELEKELKNLECLKKKKAKLLRQEEALYDKYHSRFTKLRESSLQDIEKLKAQVEQIKIDTTKKHEESLLQMRSAYSRQLDIIGNKLKHLEVIDLEFTNNKIELTLPTDIYLHSLVLDIVNTFKTSNPILHRQLDHGNFYTRSAYVSGLIHNVGWESQLNILIKKHKDKGCTNLESVVLAIFDKSPIEDIDILRPIITQQLIAHDRKFKTDFEPELISAPHECNNKIDNLLYLLTEMYTDSDDYTFEIDDSSYGRTLFMDYRGKNMPNNYQTLGDNTLFKFFPGGSEHIWLHCPSVQTNKVPCGKTGEHRLNSVDAILTKVIMYMGFMRRAEFIRK